MVEIRIADDAACRDYLVIAICDNYKAHKIKEVQAWIARHPCFKLHFTRTSYQIRRGVFKSVAELEAAIETWARRS
jgi:hypothetical protein